MAQGTGLGILYLQKQDEECAKEQFLAAKDLQLAGHVAEHIAISLSNLYLQEAQGDGKGTALCRKFGYGEGEQRRDFVYVRDLTHLNMFFAQVGPYAPKSGQATNIYRGVVNAGSGMSRSFNDVARTLMAVHAEVPIEYIPFPTDLEGRYQHFTEADPTGLRELGCSLEPTALELGIVETFATLRSIGE